MTHEDFNQAFIWERDDHLDTWRILKNFPWKGDCDDYAVTILWIECNQSILKFWLKVFTFQAIFWLVYSDSGEKHIVLHLRNKGWIDCINPHWEPACSYRKIFPMVPPLVVIKMIMGKILG